MDIHAFASDDLRISVAAAGAELQSIAHRTFGELLWEAGPAWPQHAPNLFPIVGQLVGDRLQVDGESYPLKRHGFARNRRFTWLESGSAACRLGLRDDEQTRAIFPFAFEFEIGYRVAAATLAITYTVRNTGDRILPAAVGAHPAFRWPLAPGVAKTAHTLQFERPEPAPIRRLADGLLKPERFASPIVGDVLDLDERLFVDDAIILDALESRQVRYSAPGTPAIVVGWDGFRELGIWSKGDAAFVCIEPWHGYASPVDFDGPFAAKPGVLLIPPGAERALTLTIGVEPPPGGPI